MCMVNVQFQNTEGRTHTFGFLVKNAEDGTIIKLLGFYSFRTLGLYFRVYNVVVRYTDRF